MPRFVWPSLWACRLWWRRWCSGCLSTRCTCINLGRCERKQTFRLRHRIAVTKNTARFTIGCVACCIERGTNKMRWLMHLLDALRGREAKNEYASELVKFLIAIGNTRCYSQIHFGSREAFHGYLPGMNKWQRLFVNFHVENSVENI